MRACQPSRVLWHLSSASSSSFCVLFSCASPACFLLVAVFAVLRTARILPPAPSLFCYNELHGIALMATFLIWTLPVLPTPMHGAMEWTFHRCLPHAQPSICRSKS